jgi:kynurenine formamidase
MSTKLIDLSVVIENSAYEGLWPPKITYWDHRRGAKELGRPLGINASEFPDGLGLAWEEVTLITHVGTHLDAPWHFGPMAGGEPAKTIDQIPLEWCYGDGVVLDLRHRKPGESITREDVQEALTKINYTLKPLDIVLIMTGADKYVEDVRYTEMNPGMSREATLWLGEQGIKVIGIDGYGYDKPFSVMGKEFKAGDKDALWPGHFAGREREYCHIEKLANLDQIPRPHGFKVALFPIKILNASAAWIRPVAIVEDD